MTRSPIARVRDWLDAADPGGVRRTQGARTVLAALATLAILKALSLLGVTPSAGSIGFGVLAAFLCGMIVGDPLRRDRAITLGWAVPVFALGATLAALSEPVKFLPSIVLLALIALAFIARRAGRRPTELAVLLAMGTYFAEGGSATLDSLAWFVAAAALGVAMFAFCLLVLLPYDPARAIIGAARAYAVRIADVVTRVAAIVRDPSVDAAGLGAVATTVAGPGSPASQEDEGLARRLRMARLTRRVMEAQLPGARAPEGWTATQITRLQVALYEAELGASQLVDGCADRESLAATPADIRAALASTLDALADALGDVRDPAIMEALAGRADDLRDRFMAVMEAAPDDPTTGASTPPSWVAGGLRIANGGRRIARAIAGARSIQASVAEASAGGPAEAAGRAGAPGPTAQAPGPAVQAPGQRPAARPPGGPQVRIGGLTVHVTTALAIQAVLATGLAMAVAWLWGVEHPNWVFWTSFVVIAGSLDESLNRMVNRIAGTIAGVILGVLLALLLPNDIVWVAIAATGAVYLAIYWAPVSQAWSVFWLNVAFAVVYTGPGGDIFELLVERPLMTIIGAGISALIVTRVLPVRSSGRYTVALVALLGSVREAVTALTAATASAAPGPGPLSAVDAAYRQVEAAAQARHSGLRFAADEQEEQHEETQVAAIVAAVARLGDAVEIDPDAVHRGRTAAVGARIVQNLDAMMSIARGTPAVLAPTLDDLLASGQRPGMRRDSPVAGSPEDGTAGAPRSGAVLAAMIDVHTSVVRLGTTLSEGPALAAARRRAAKA